MTFHQTNVIAAALMSIAAAVSASGLIVGSAAFDLLSGISAGMLTLSFVSAYLHDRSNKP